MTALPLDARDEPYGGIGRARNNDPARPEPNGRDGAAAHVSEGVSIHDFNAYMPTTAEIYIGVEPTIETAIIFVIWGVIMGDSDVSTACYC